MPFLSPHHWSLGLMGLVSGLLAGLLGIGGGTILVPGLVMLHYTPIQAVATSNLAIAITALSGSLQNWRAGRLDGLLVLTLGLPALFTAQLGVIWSNQLSPPILMTAFGCFLLANGILVWWRDRLERQEKTPALPLSPLLAKLLTGGAAGVLAGLFGVGGGVIMVPLQRVLLAEPIKKAIQTSLGVIVLTAIAAVVGQGLKGNVLVNVGLELGLGGLVGAQISTRFLPKLPASVVTVCFYSFLLALAIYTFRQALTL
jgi:hypothetical protein